MITTMDMPKKIIAVTIGDPAGIGAEVVLKALDCKAIAARADFVLIGDRPVIEEASRLTGIALSEKIKIVESGIIKDNSFKRGEVSAEGGRAAASYIKMAVDMALSKKVDAITTAPITKEAFDKGGIKWHGHTEMLAELSGTRDYAMMLCGGPLRVMLVTIHRAIRDVPVLLTTEGITKTIRLANRACRMLDLKNPKIAVASLNPHAGEGGLFGSEEAEVIVPAVERAIKEGIGVSGPHPPDTVFHRAYKGEFDMVVCMYHDQGLIPLKMIAFDKGVNVTVGIPFIRTSPDHGTAYDIAWKGIADPSSMIEAINMALSLRL